MIEHWTYSTLIATFEADEEGTRERLLFIPQHVDKVDQEEALAITPIEVWDRWAHLRVDEESRIF